MGLVALTYSRGVPLDTGVEMPQRFLRIHEVMSRTGLSRPTIYRRCAAGTFPRQIPLGNPHIVGWLDSAIEEWQQAQVDAASACDARDDRDLSKIKPSRVR